MTDKLIPFVNERFGEVRTLVIDGGPWFCGTDICRALEIAKPTDSLALLDEDEKNTIYGDSSTIGAKYGISWDGRVKSMVFISEPGLYTLILRSRKPKAMDFKRWITHEVIPALRKTGSYSLPGVSESTLDSLLADPTAFFKVMDKWREDHAGRLLAESQVTALEEKVIDDAPKVQFADSVLKEDGEVSVKVLAADVFQAGNSKVGLINMYKLLDAAGETYMSEGIHMPTQNALRAKRLKLRDVTKRYKSGPKTYRVTMVTAKGRIDYVEMFGRNNPLGTNTEKLLKKTLRPRKRINGLKLIK
jgi:anti-repressor protein